MRKFLIATAAVLAMSASAMADTVTNLGTNPTSGVGAFSNTNPGTGGGGSGVFADIYTFDIIGQQILTIAFATNTFAGGAAQFITNFQGSVFSDGPNGVPGGGDDLLIFGPQMASACIGVPSCQIFGGSALLNQDSYYLLIAGNAAVDAGYGGNLSTAAPPEVPLPGAVWLFGTVIGLFTLFRKKLLRQPAMAAA